MERRLLLRAYRTVTGVSSHHHRSLPPFFSLELERAVLTRGLGGLSGSD